VGRRGGLLGAALAAASAVLALIVTTVRLDRRRDARFASALHVLRDAYSEPYTYRVATVDEAATVAEVRLAGMRPLGVLATMIHGEHSVIRYVVDDTGAVVASASSANALHLFSTTGTAFFETERFPIGMPCVPPEVDSVTFF
jgi:hypothetical protein